jgi:hypothetical protein
MRSLYQAISIAGLITLLAGCVTWQHDVEVNGIHFKKYAAASVRGDNIGYLAEDAVVQGYPCKAGFIALHDDLSLWLFTAASPIEFGDITIPPKTYVGINERGHIDGCAFPADIEIQGHLCRGGWGGAQGVTTSFYDSGRLCYFFSREDVEVDGVFCKGSLLHGIRLHEDGSLSECRSARMQTVGGVTYGKGSEIELNPE